MVKDIIEILKQIWYDTPIHLMGFSFILFILAVGLKYVFRVFWNSYEIQFLPSKSHSEIVECAENLTYVSERLDALTAQKPVPSAVSVDVKIIPKYVRCRYCDSMFESGTLVCVNCGGNLEQLEVF